MSSDYAIKVTNLSKCYETYKNPIDRLKQFLLDVFKIDKKVYGEYWALNNIEFSVKKGETFGIIGRNGSGKSTLLQIICGTMQPTSGNVDVNGRVAALLELGSGFNPEFTGRENVYLNATILGLRKKVIDERYQSIIDFADIGAFIDLPVKTYSSGMMVRLAFAVIAHVDADILVIDEALAVGDAFFTQKCMRFLRSFMKRGTVLFVSHDTASVKALCDTALWIERGSQIELGKPSAVANKYLEAFYEVKKNNATTIEIKDEYKQQLQTVSVRDQRDDYINSSNLRNDIEIFEFDEESQSFGTHLAKIVDVKFEDSNGNQLSWIVGGEKVVLKIYAVSSENLEAPIFGFYIKDKLGQNIFGDNTYLSYANETLVMEKGCLVSGAFTFTMPRLQKGDYSVNAALATGTQDDHVQHHWIHDALIFKSENTSVASGLIGIPLEKIEISNILESDKKD